MTDANSDPNDVNNQDDGGWTPLHHAAYRGQSDIATMLMNSGANFEIKNEWGRTPLHIAASQGMSEIATLLMDAGANLDVKNDWGNTPLHYAAYDGKREVAILLIERGAETEIINARGETPVTAAVEHNKYYTVSALLQYGARFSAKISVPKLLNAACKKGDLDVVKIARRKGANLNQEGKDSETPILLASRNANYKIVKYLCENGVDAGISDGKGHSILHKPAIDGEMEIVKALLSRGADPSGGLQGALDFYQGDIVKLLIAKGADVNKVRVVFYHFYR